MGINEDFTPLPSANDIASASGLTPHPLASVEGTDWHIAFADLIDPFTLPIAELEEWRETAPDVRIRDWLQGVIDTRTKFSGVSGMKFDPLTLSRVELQRLRDSASSGRVRDWMQGIIDTRTMFSVVTGNKF